MSDRPQVGDYNIYEVALVHTRLIDRIAEVFPHWKRTPLTSFGITGVIWTCTFHSCPLIRGCTGMYCTERVNLTGRRPNFTTLPRPSPMGTVQTSGDGAFQSTRILPE